MNKILFKRITTLFILLILFLVPFFIKSSKTINNSDWDKNKGSVIFSNKFDDLNLEGFDDEVDKYITMTEIYEHMILNRHSKTDNQLKGEIEGLIDDSVGISISNADELYYFANAQSINFNEAGKTNTAIYKETIKYLLDQKYVLLDDIDYSVKRAQKFVPIGTNIDLSGSNEIESEDSYHFPFTGEFEGNGFEIKNLYLAEYSYITTTFEDEGASSAVTVALFKHYSMFSEVGENALIKNFILRNPILDVATLDATSGLFNTSYLAGANAGKIYNVAVIDEKRTQAGIDNSGISFNVAYPSNEEYKAAGFVFENKESGKVYNSYFISKNVIATNSQSRFNHIYPFVFINDGDINGVNYNDDITLKNDSNKPSIGGSISKEKLINGNNSTINDFNINDLKWHFYTEDGYPQLKSLTYQNNRYLIKDDRDLMYFSYLINLNSTVNNKPFNEHEFHIDENINMKNYTRYKTPSKEFKGKLTSYNKYIYNMEFNYPYVKGNNFYLGLFSVLSGKVDSINFVSNKMTLKNTDLHYGKVFFVGLVSGKMNNAIISNVYLNNKINLGKDTLGLTYAGSLVGYGNGTIEKVQTSSSNEINGNKHDFNNRSINGNFYIGGIIGKNNNKLTISNTINRGNVIGVGLKENKKYQASNGINSYVGGIIGEVNNIENDTTSIKYVTNEGLVDANLFKGVENSEVNKYIGGIFGSTKGKGYKLNDVYNGRLENKGNIKAEFINEHTKVYTAGIGVMNTDEEYAKVSYLINKAGYNFDGFNYQTHNSNLFYSQTILDNSVGGVELSRAYNTNSVTLNNNYFNNAIQNYSAFEGDEIEIGMFFVSTKNNPSKLLYVENRGNLTVGSPNTESTVDRKLKISNITQATRVDYKNVVNSGNIEVLNIKNTNGDIYVAGITWILPYDQRPYKMENILNEGNIITADIKSNTTINGNPSGQSYNSSEFDGSFNSVRNLYVSGIVNLNVGEITNSFNLGNITSTYNANLKNVTGTANTFVGGINTINFNLIQDVANSGLIEYTNDNNNSKAYFAGVDYARTNISKHGGLAIVYQGGITLGGISAALGDVSGTVLSGHANDFVNNEEPVAKIIDIINNGDVFGKSKEYVRSGGILGIALSSELTAGTFRNHSSGNTIPGPFTTASLGQSDPIGESLLSNGLNYGNVYSVTNTIGEYKQRVGTGWSDTDANSERPGINAVSGGVVGYGLTEMVRMLNHGVISSTDVAGGIVGATYILGNDVDSGAPITRVNINTAVHYGRVKAIRNSNYSSFTYNENEDFNNTTKFYPDNDTSFIFANSDSYDIARYPNRRRGFGGIFGRTQRGRYGSMRAEQFDNIMNMDPNIDFIGRADSNIVASIRFYRLFNEEETHYTARENDTTMNAIMGWIYSKTDNFTFDNVDVRFTIDRSGSNYYITKIEILSGQATNNQQVSKIVVPNTATNTETRYLERIYMQDGVIYEGNNTGTNYRIDNFNISTSDFGTGGQFPKTYTAYNYNKQTPFSITETSGSRSTPPTSNNLKNKLIVVKEEDLYNETYNIFGENFPLRRQENSEYIYPVEEDALAERFKSGGQNAKPNGMYVLSSSTGSRDGASLPTNINITNLFKIKESDQLEYIDLSDVPFENLVSESDSVETLLDSYSNMFQISFNEKSEVLSEDETQPLISELSLYDPNGNSPTLIGGQIDHNKKEIIFNVSSDAFTSDDVNYEVLYNKLSRNAVISKDAITPEEASDFRLAYKDRVNEIIEDEDFKFNYSGSFNNTNKIEFNMRVYAEIVAELGETYPQLLNKYVTDYTVKIVKTDSLDIDLEVKVDDSLVDIGNSQQESIDISGNEYENNYLNPNGNIDLTFTENNSLLPNNHEMSIKGLYVLLDGNYEEVSDEFYDLIINKKDGDSLGFNMTLSDELISGTYKIKYGFYNNILDREIIFTKGVSSNKDVIDISYSEYSKDKEGKDLSFTKTNNDFETFIKFGLVYNNLISKDGEQTLTIEEITNNMEYDYTNNVKYYELYLDGEYILTIKLSPFAVLDEALISYEYNNDGTISYTLEYKITDETDNVDNVSNIEHKITERDVATKDIYLNDNLQTSTNLEVTREALESYIDIDYDFSESNYNSKISFKILDENNIDITDAILNNREVYTGNNIDLYNLIITNKLDKGNYVFTMYITREDNIYELGSFNLIKLEGSSAYLLDVKFVTDETDMVFRYPTIRPSNDEGEPNNNYDTRIDFAGIDYAGVDDNEVKHFRIDARVSDILLEDFEPLFTLPAGAKIERKIGEDSYTNDLNADFVGIEDELPIITYRVTSEDEESVVYYHITVLDIKYNLTLKFKIFYRDENGNIMEANNNNSPIKNDVVLISSKNLKIDGNLGVNSIIENVYEFPQINNNQLMGINNQSALYYFIGSTTNFRFGLNMSGAYNFNIITPKYTGISNDNQSTNERYNYSMYMMPREETGLSWAQPKYKLPDMKSISDEYAGLYYYVYNPSENPIIRELAIVVDYSTRNLKWGLNDDFASWD